MPSITFDTFDIDMLIIVMNFLKKKTIGFLRGEKPGVFMTSLPRIQIKKVRFHIEMKLSEKY